MNKRTFVLVSVVVLLLVGGAFWIGKKSDNIPSGSQRVERDNGANEIDLFTLDKDEFSGFVDDFYDTKEWETYRNEKLGFEVRYPEDIFSIEEYKGGIMFSVKNESKRNIYADWGIQTVRNEQLSNGKYQGLDRFSTPSTSEEDILRRTIQIQVGDKQVYINPISQYTCIEEPTCVSAQGAYIIPSEKDRFYSISYSDSLSAYLEGNPGVDHPDQKKTRPNLQSPKIMERMFFQFIMEFKSL